MRMPLHYQTQWVYALTMGFAAMIFMLLYSGVLYFILGNVGINSVVDAPMQVLAAFPASFLAWPRFTKRSRARMAVSGCVLVLLTLTFYGAYVGWVNIRFLDLSMIDALSAILSYGLTVIAFGSIATLGLPYLIFPWLSVLFSES